MLKLVTFAGYDTSGPHIFPIEPDVERTIGHIKMARALPAEIEKYIRCAKPIPGKTQLLIDAMGAGEYYGSNSNGDYFPEDALRHKGPDYGHETFMHYAYPYKHHCFPAGTSVAMANGERTLIEQVQVGDLVLTSKGGRKVKNVMRRPYRGDGVAIKAGGRSDRLNCTADHPVLAFRRDVIHCRHRYSRLAAIHGTPQKRPHEKQCVEFREGIPNVAPQWIPASELQPGDYITRARYEPGTVEIDDALAEAIGWVAADGCLSKGGLIQFTFGQNSPKTASVSNVFERLDCHVCITPRNDGLVAVSISDTSIWNQIAPYVEGKLTEKCLTKKTLELAPRVLKRLLSAYVDGDGHVGTKSNKGWLRIRSASPSMLQSLGDLIESLGVPVSINWDGGPQTFISPTNGKEYASNGSGVVSVPGTLTAEIAPHSQKVASADFDPARVRPALRWENLILARVMEVDDIDLECEVFNLEVEDVHEYMAGEMLVHNCNKDPARAYGERVTLAAYDDAMHRVLLIVRIDDSKCQDILSDLANGHYWSVSMGCKVPWDECSICRNRARNRREYCPHLRYQMNKVLPDGRRVFAYNHLPKFFDISFVTIGAEKAAYVLKKVASLGPGAAANISSAALAEQVYGKLAGDKRAADKKAEIEKDVPSQPEGTFEGVTPQDKAKLNRHMGIMGALKSREPGLPANQLALSGIPLKKILGTIAACGIDLRPEEYQRIVLVKQGAAKLADALERRGIVFDAYGPSTVPKWASLLGPDDVSEKVALQLQPHLIRRSCYPEPLEARLQAMSKVADFEGYQRNTQWYPMTDEELRASSGTSGLSGAMAALAGGFLVFRRAFPGLTMKGGAPVQAIAKHPWLLPILIGAGIGASVGFGESRRPLSLAPYAQGGGVDGMKTAAYHRAKTAGLYSQGMGSAPLAYIYSDVHALRQHTKTAFDFFAKARPAEARGLTRYARTPSSLMEKAAMLEGSYDARIYGLVDRVARLRKG